MNVCVARRRPPTRILLTACNFIDGDRQTAAAGDLTRGGMCRVGEGGGGRAGDGVPCYCTQVVTMLHGHTACIWPEIPDIRHAQ